MGHGPESPDDRRGDPVQAQRGAAAGDEHPEARGFGASSRRRFRQEVAIALLVLAALAALVFWGSRGLAEAAAMRLPPAMDEKLGRPTWMALQMSGQRCDQPALEEYVQGILKPLTEELGETPFRFQLMVVEDDAVNAFALPGGFLAVNSGLLAHAESGEEVAAVLAHELSHVTLRHSTRRLAASLGVSTALALVLGVVDLGAHAYTLAYLARLGYGRDQEREADEQGLALLQRAGISPLGMATFFERLRSSPQPPELLSTHPDPGDRAERARRAAERFQPRLTLPPPPRSSCRAAAK